MGVAIYDIAAHAVYLPNGNRLEAHSGLGGSWITHVRGIEELRPTPPNVYDWSCASSVFTGCARSG